MKKENLFICLFGHDIISNGLYQAIKNNIVAKKTTELALLFHKKTTKPVFHWPNMSQKASKNEFSCLFTYLILQTSEEWWIIKNICDIKENNIIY